MGRGIEKMIEAIPMMDNAILLIAGVGYLDAELRVLADRMGDNERVSFLGRYSLEALHEVTCTASIGVSLEEDLGLNYRYALPNKVFDYIQAGLPVLVSDLPEMAALVSELGNGQVISSDCTPAELAVTLEGMLCDTQRMVEWGKRSAEAAKYLTWENEQEKLIELCKEVLGE